MFRTKGLVKIYSKLNDGCIISVRFSQFRWQNPFSVYQKLKFHISHAQNDTSNKITYKSLPQFEQINDKKVDIVLDVEEERKKILDRGESFKQNLTNINFKRGIFGVFDVEEIVDILRQEKAEDIFVVKVPLEINYVDHIVIATGRSNRHMLAMSEFIRKIFKKKRFSSDIIPNLEGKNSKNWMALDLGNISLHVFSKSGRDLYDLESLWAVGKQYDSQLKKQNLPSNDISIDYSTLLAKLIPEVSPQKSNN